MPDYSELDRPSILTYVFYPRDTFSTCPRWGFDHLVPVAEDISIHCRFYKENDHWPWVLHFHGNGEVVSDYDEIAIFYLKYGINLVVADYRGYGKSTGDPTITDISHDAHIVYDSVMKELTERGFRPSLWVMGRSLGSIPALEIAYRQKDTIRGLIIESGFPSITRLLAHLDVPATGIDLDAIDRQCLDMVREITTPALIIHGEYDTLVPLEEAETLSEQIGSDEKELLIIPGGNHNDIMFVGLKQYFEAIKRFIDKGEQHTSML
jgi:alpha-beta hydrolase superfamily lysophospholipase